jgi:azurin
LKGSLRWIGVASVVLGLVTMRAIWDDRTVAPGRDPVASSAFFQPAGTPASTQDATPAASPEATPDCPRNPPPGRIVGVTYAVTITLTDQGFDPATIQATSGHDLTITLINTGARPHAFVLEEFAIDVELPPGASETITISPGDRGDAVTYVFASDSPGDACMRGTLVFYV